MPAEPETNDGGVSALVGGIFGKMFGSDGNDSTSGEETAPDDISLEEASPSVVEVPTDAAVDSPTNVKLAEIREKMKIPEGVELTAQRIASMVPVEGTLAERIDALHAKLCAEGEEVIAQASDAPDEGGDAQEASERADSEVMGNSDRSTSNETAEASEQAAVEAADYIDTGREGAMESASDQAAFDAFCEERAAAATDGTVDAAPASARARAQVAASLTAAGSTARSMMIRASSFGRKPRAAGAPKPLAVKVDKVASKAPPEPKRRQHSIELDRGSKDGPLGVSLADVVGVGVVVTEIEAGTPAASSGLKAGDCIVCAGSEWISTVEELQAQLKRVLGSVDLRVTRAVSLPKGWRSAPDETGERTIYYRKGGGAPLVMTYQHPVAVATHTPLAPLAPLKQPSGPMITPQPLVHSVRA